MHARRFPQGKLAIDIQRRELQMKLDGAITVSMWCHLYISDPKENRLAIGTKALFGRTPPQGLLWRNQSHFGGKRNSISFIFH